jgi:glucose/arabinose dehydrogenase
MTQPPGSARRLSSPHRLVAIGTALALMLLAGTASVAVGRPVAVDAAPQGALAVPGPGSVVLQLRASGLSNPVFVTSTRDSTGRLFIVEQTGRIRIYQGGNVLTTPFLSIAGLAGGYEQGLLGLAFHPSYASNRKLYVNLTNAAGDTLIREYRASSTNPNVVDTATARNVLKISQPYANHNGGMLAFGPDGYLYIGMGDGGSGGDPGNRAQSTNTLLGKMLRINVNGTTSTRGYLIPSTNPYVGKTGLDEIWQIGLRNPWRFSFDRANGNLWIGDVGQGAWEEIDRAVKTANGAGRGVNWGWRVMEGRHCYNPSSGCSSAGKNLPITEFDHGNGRCSVTGGYVYRGAAIPALAGSYVFADFCSGEIFWITANAAPPQARHLLLDTAFNISSFGEDAAGELYVVDHGGALYAIAKA